MKQAILSGAIAICASFAAAGCAGVKFSPPPATGPSTGYIIGAEDVLRVVFWRDDQMSGEVVVRPDGKISVPLLNDVQAAGLTPEQLRDQLVATAAKFLDDPSATVTVKQINSRRVFITGNVTQSGAHPLTGNMNVLQLIALAGGFLEYADSEHVVIVRPEGDQTLYFRFSYADVIEKGRIEQNIALKPGDTVVVP